MRKVLLIREVHLKLDEIDKKVVKLIEEEV